MCQICSSGQLRFLKLRCVLIRKMPERKEQRDALVAMPTWTAFTVKFYNHECVSIENEKHERLAEVYKMTYHCLSCGYNCYFLDITFSIFHFQISWRTYKSIYSVKGSKRGRGKIHHFRLLNHSSCSVFQCIWKCYNNC